MDSLPIKRILRLVVCIISVFLLGSLPILPVFWIWKIVIAIIIIFLNVKLSFRFFDEKPVLYQLFDNQENSCCPIPPGEYSTEKDKIKPLAQEFDRIFTELDFFKHKIETIYSTAEQKINYHTTSLNNIIQQLHRDANQDCMTGLPNRRHFGQCSLKLFEHSCQNGWDLACIMIDIDNFKKVNDQYSHATGDCVIVMTGEILKASVRQGDLCARFGGDEFVMLLQKCSCKKAWHIAERIREKFTQKTNQIMNHNTKENAFNCISDAPKDNNLSKLTGLSIGIATLKRNRPDNLEQLIHMADKALYQAKENGRNCNQCQI